MCFVRPSSLLLTPSWSSTITRPATPPPSQTDSYNLTRRLAEAAELLQIKLHQITHHWCAHRKAPTAYFSFKEAGIL